MEMPAEGFGPVFEPEQAGAVTEVGAAAAVVADAQAQDTAAGAAWTLAAVARACLAALVSASATV